MSLECTSVQAFSPRRDQNISFVSLPTSIDYIIQNIDAVIVTHQHFDHWDDAAKEAFPKDIKLFSQNEEDAAEIRNAGFHNVEVLKEDTVWYEAVQEVIDTHKPEIIVLNAGDNQFFEGGSLAMGKDDVYEVYTAAPNAKIITVHMEAVNQWALSREELKSFINEKGISSKVLFPEDGESLFIIKKKVDGNLKLPSIFK